MKLHRHPGKKNILKYVASVYSAAFTLTILIMACTVYTVFSQILFRDIRISRSELMDQAVASIETQVRDIYLNVYQQLENSLSVRRFFSGSSPNYNVMDSRSVMDSLNTLKNFNHQIDSISLYSPARDLVIAPHISASLEDYEGPYCTHYDEISRLLAQTQPVKPLQQLKPDCLSLVLPYPMNAKDFHQGLIVIDIKSDLFLPINSDMQTMVLRDRDGQIMIPGSRRASQSVQQFLEKYPDVLSNASADRPFFRCRGKSIFTCSSSLPRCDFILIMENKTAFGTQYGFAITLASVALVLILLLYFVNRQLSRYTLSPVEQLLETIGKSVLKRSEPVPLSVMSRQVLELVSQNEQQHDVQQKMYPALKWVTVQRMLTGALSNYASAQPDLEILKIPFGPANYIVLTVVPELSSPLSAEQDMDLEICLQDQLDRYFTNCMIRIENQFSAILFFTTRDGETNSRYALESAARIVEALQSSLSIRSYIGVGSFYSDFSQIHLSYSESLRALSYRMVITDNGVIPFTEIADYPFTPPDCTAIQDALRRRDPDLLSGAIDKIYAKCKERKVSSEFIYQISILVLANILDFLSSAGITPETYPAISEISFHDVRLRLISARNLSEVKQMVTDLAQKYCRILLDRDEAIKGDSKIQQIQDFLDSSFQDSNVSLNLVSERFHYNSTYLCTVFKKHTGKSFNEYLMELRVNRAKVLLRTTDTPISQISAMVGYTSYNGFIRTFKNFTGETPSAYRSNSDFLSE